MKPLFIPLNRHWYTEFAEGRKRVEYRPYGPRWNECTCPPGRPALLSLGYGKAHRLSACVERFEKLDTPPDPEAWASVYPDKSGPVAAIHLTEVKPLTTDH